MVASAYTPFDVSTKDRVVGFFVIGAFLLFLIGFLIPFALRFSDDDGMPFYTVIDQTYGIAPEATVALRGVVIGSVTAVGITTDGMVRVDFRLSPIYQSFYTKNSNLTVDTNISASTILTGSGLVLVPSNPNNGLMGAGEFIPTDAPHGLATILEELDVVQLTDQVTEIIASIESVTTGFAENQGKIYASIDHLQVVTQSLAEVSKELPGMIRSIDESLAALQGTITGLDQMVAKSDTDLQAALKNTVLLTEQAKITLKETESLFKATTPVMKQLPTVLVTTDIALQDISELTNQLSQSWLFGGSSGPVDVPRSPVLHPHDDALYGVESTAQNE